MPQELRALFERVTKGALSGPAGETAREEFKVNGEYVNTPEKGVVGIPFLDEYVEKASAEYLDKASKSGKPFFMSINFMKVHQPNLPHPDFIHKSPSKSKYANSVVEADTRIGHILDKVRALGLDKNTYVFWTTDNGAWQDVYPNAGYTPFRGTKGTVREGGNRVRPWRGGQISRPVQGTTISSAAWTSWPRSRLLPGTKLPEKDREGQPIVFDSYDISPVLFSAGPVPPGLLVLFHRKRAEPWRRPLAQLQVRVQSAGRYGQATGGLAVDANLGWKGAEKYVATVPQVFDLWQDPQERYDIFMNNFTEQTWVAVVMNKEIEKLMKTYIQYPPRKLQSETYTGPVHASRTTSSSDGFGISLRRRGSSLPMPTRQLVRPAVSYPRQSGREPLAGRLLQGAARTLAAMLAYTWSY